MYELLTGLPQPYDDDDNDRRAPRVPPGMKATRVQGPVRPRSASTPRVPESLRDKARRLGHRDGVPDWWKEARTEWVAVEPDSSSR